MPQMRTVVTRGSVYHGCAEHVVPCPRSRSSIRRACRRFRSITRGTAMILTCSVSNSAGNVYITGSFEGTIDFGGGALAATPDPAFVSGFASNVWIAKLDSNGNYLWAKRFCDQGA